MRKLFLKNYNSDPFVKEFFTHQCDKNSCSFMDLWPPVFLVDRSICQFVVVSLILLSFCFSRSPYMALNINERQGYHKLQKIQWIFHFQLLYVAYLHASVSCLGSKIISKLDILSQNLLETTHFDLIGEYFFAGLNNTKTMPNYQIAEFLYDP